MRLLYFNKRIQEIYFYSLIAIGACFISLTGIVQAEDLPKFKPGMWEYHRSIENPNDPQNPRTMVTTKCTNPSEDMKKQNEMASKMGCNISPMIKSGNKYTLTESCNIQNTSVQSKSTITVENDSAYSVEVDVKSAAKSTKEVFRARRTGDCTK
jgi:hypothetical protein